MKAAMRHKGTERCCARKNVVKSGKSGVRSNIQLETGNWNKENIPRAGTREVPCRVQ